MLLVGTSGDCGQVHVIASCVTCDKTNQMSTDKYSTGYIRYNDDGGAQIKLNTTIIAL